MSAYCPIAGQLTAESACARSDCKRAEPWKLFSGGSNSSNGHYGPFSGSSCGLQIAAGESFARRVFPDVHSDGLSKFTFAEKEPYRPHLVFQIMERNDYSANKIWPLRNDLFGGLLVILWGAKRRAEDTTVEGTHQR
jgi:hypothetical protein